MTTADDILKETAAEYGIDVEALKQARALRRPPKVEQLNAMAHTWGSQSPDRNSSLVAVVSTGVGFFAALSIAPALVMAGSVAYAMVKTNENTKKRTQTWFETPRN